MTWAHLLDNTMDKTMDKTKISFDVQLLQQIQHNNNDRVKLTLQVAKHLCNAVDASGDSLLHYAAKFGNETVTIYLIELGAKINVENEDGDTPLLLATKAKNAAIVKILLKSDADIYICNQKYESAVRIALQTSPTDVEMATLFLQRISSDCSSDNTEITEVLMKMNCPLYVVVLLENVDVTKCMLSQNCAIEAKDSTSGKTALHVAVENVDLKHVEKLVFLGADVEAKDASGKIPLALLSDFSKPDKAFNILQTLSGVKENLTTCDDDGFMQMRSVIQNGTDKAVKKVLNSSCDITVEDQNKQNIIFYLARNCNPGIKELIFDSKKLSAIAYKNFSLDKFDLNARDKFGLTALHHAVDAGNPIFVRLLISKRVNLHILSNVGVSPLLQAVQATTTTRSSLEQRVECVKILLWNGARPDIFMGHYFKIYSESEIAMHLDYPLLEPAVAALALRRFSGRSDFHQGILKKIQSHPKLKRYFDLCTSELEKMKSDKIGWNMSAFDLLAIRQYSRYSMFFVISGIWAKRVIRKYPSIPFYYDFLNNRVCEVMRRKKAEMRANLFFLIVVIGILLFLGVLAFFIGSLNPTKKIRELVRDFTEENREPFNQWYHTR